MNRKINVLYISVGEGGSDIALLNMLNGLSVYENINPVVLVNPRKVLIPELESRNIVYKIVNYKFSLWPRFNYWSEKIRYPWRLISNPIKNFIAVKKIIKIASDYNIDIIHTNVGVIQIGYIVAKKLGIPHIWHLREYQGPEFKMCQFPSKKFFFDKLNNDNNYSIAITNGVYNHFKLNQQNSCLIYDGVLKNNQTRFILEKEKYFLFVGKITDNKGVTELLEAFIEFAKTDELYELRIVAKFTINEYTRTLIKKIKKSGLQDRIKFLGYRQDTYELMSTASALIVPSKFEGFGLTTAEAMFNGCLVIGKDISGTKEQFDNGLKECGLEIGIRYSTLKELTLAMNDVKTNGIQHYVEQIKNAQATVKGLYSIEKNTQEINLLYKKTMNKINRRIIK
ncbi:glycosyltransferase [Albibacterium bauzanense]|uniref:Glycosyltransferase involved in cell wall biosynthesis n=1 Tax=Albibacterium bauzanense TaxID=653929 RepID=A0A4R1M282_9SPHI|nr:glycosyltransferase [Albibacterium bauzanense]TCK84944.1 glycosyltransferase involved in cell wall biosynthesis [Albibacterium bauzanense]